jgi:hypothetical protein
MKCLWPLFLGFLLTDVVGQDFETLVKLPKDSLINRAVKILSEKDSRFSLSDYDQVSVWQVPYKGFQTNRRDSLAPPQKREWHVMVKFSQHTVFFFKKKEYVCGMSVEFLINGVAYLNETGSSTDASNDFFHPTKKQRAEIAFVKDQLGKSDRLSRHFEKSKDVGHLYIQHEGSRYKLIIQVSPGESYTFTMKKRTGEISKPIRYLENAGRKSNVVKPVRLY